MAKRDSRKARKEQYRAILNAIGVDFDRCDVLAFVFERPLGPQSFHFYLMETLSRPEYHLFDCLGNMAQIVISKDEKIAARIRALAKEVGGTETTPNLV